MTAPDFIEPLIGFRAWHLDPDGSLVPWSLQGAGAWQPGVNTAECHAGKDHQPPATGCMCGLYALATACDHRLHGRDGQIVGAIAAWGDIELHRTGFRAQHAAIVALARPHGRHEAAERAAARHEVPLVEFDELEVTVRGHGRPIDPSLLEDDRPQPERHRGETGIALVEHVWCRVEANELVIGITDAFAGLLDDDVEITLPPVMTRVEAGDPLATLDSRHGTLVAWACAAGFVVERNDDPSAGWLARIAPTNWPADARNFSWGPAAQASYAAQLARTGAGEDVFADLRAERLFAGPPSDGMIDIVAELRRRRAQPRFGSEGDVYAACAEPVRERIAGSRQLKRLQRLGMVVRYSVTQPDAEMTLCAISDGVSLTCGPAGIAPTLTLTMTAETAARHFAGRLDIARALRAGLVTSDRSPVETLRTIAMLKPLLGRF